MKIEDMSPQQRRAEIAEILGRAMVRMQQQAAAKLRAREDEAALERPTRTLSTSATAGGAYE